MIDIKNLLLGLMLVVVACSPAKRPVDEQDGESTDTDTDSDSDTDTGPVECDLGEYSGDFTISTQSDVATIAGYTSIWGELWIHCPLCSDVSELSCLTSVGEDLNIQYNDALADLDGLGALTSVVGNLTIRSNPIIANLDGLSGLTGSLGVTLWIEDNDALNNLDGLNGITSVSDSIRIRCNDVLTNLDGLSGLTSVNYWLMIDSNSTLPDCEVCDLLDHLTNSPNDIDVHDNLADSCTPVPASCP